MNFPTHYGVKNLETLPYEKLGYAQHGETGIIETMTDAIKHKTNMFFEIGFSSGAMNMTRDLFTKGWSGVGVDMYEAPSDKLGPLSKVNYIKCKVEPDNLLDILQEVDVQVDFFSLDIDSYDFEIAEKLLSLGWQPKTVCLEFNPKFGSTAHASFPFRVGKKIFNKKGLYGSSLAKYIALWTSHGYRYFGFDSTFTNVFFYHPDTVNDLSHLKIYQPEDLPFANDDIMLTMIKMHPIWNIEDIWTRSSK